MRADESDVANNWDALRAKIFENAQCVLPAGDGEGNGGGDDDAVLDAMIQEAGDGGGTLRWHIQEIRACP
eukprot:5108369-Alexandrium_andersonii.AAC.1